MTRRLMSLLPAIMGGLGGAPFGQTSSTAPKEPREETPANRRWWEIMVARRKHAAKPQSVMTRQRYRAELRKQWYETVRDGTRAERRKLARAYAASEFREMRAKESA